MIATLVACAAAGWLAERFAVPAGWLTGSFFLSSLLNGTGFVELTIPDVAVAPAYIGLGAMIGTRFGGASLRLFVSALWASVGAFAVGISVSAAFSALIASLTDIPFGQALLAYAPGGLEAMTLLAFLLGLDPAYVATHQLVRYMVMVFALPVAVRLVLGRDWRAPRAD
ncbi:AbrB family transcriptional regulator [Breoghania sp. L-A4]|uniref:AbrB family transcriptional regulator n=1 Tax=Breoghania sp. L-A4 TaxID=2304600 RepID=UPI0013C2D7E9|nr:AbrB family transcriptional regulator [Breoghania sp. L-A4]